MRLSLLLLLAALSLTRAAEPPPFDSQKVPCLAPGKTYHFTIHPGKKAPPLLITFVAESEAAGEQNGQPYARPESISFDHVTFDTHVVSGPQDIEFQDYDGDGYLELRVLNDWGTGGSTYDYYRFDGHHYVPWAEPTDLGINYIDPAHSYAHAHGRSGPAWAEYRYHIKNGHFILYEQERFDQASSIEPRLRATIPPGTPGNTYLDILETIKNNRITATAPTDPDTDRKTLLNTNVNEPWQK